MKKDLTVYSPGTKVTISEDIPAIIAEVLIKEGDHVLYQVVWWEKGSRKVEWLTISEITFSEEDEKRQIGFV